MDLLSVAFVQHVAKPACHGLNVRFWHLQVLAPPTPGVHAIGIGADRV